MFQSRFSPRVCVVYCHIYDVYKEVPFHLDKKVLHAGFTYFFSIFCCKSIDLKAFHAFGRISFRWLVFSFFNVLSKKY